MIRNIVAVIAAFITGGIAVFGIEALSHSFYPLPEGMDPSDMKQIAEYIKTAPIGPMVFVLLAQSAGSFVGGFVTGLISRSKQTVVAIVYGLLGLAMAALNLILVPVHPLWFAIASVILPIPLALVGSSLARKLFASGLNSDQHSTKIEPLPK